VSSQVYGTLTIGRQQALQFDALAQYDPQTLSYAFSFLGYSGFDGGAGSTAGARWDNSAKYVYQHGPIHVAAMSSNGGVDTGVLGRAYGADLGGTFFGLSIDAVYQQENGAAPAVSVKHRCRRITPSTSIGTSMPGSITRKSRTGLPMGLSAPRPMARQEAKARPPLCLEVD
jgi:predicted porin